MSALGWTDDRVEQLKKLWEAGFSASQIAAELSCPQFYVSRNSVISKIHRLGLSGRRKAPSSPAPRQRKPKQYTSRGSNFINVRPATNAVVALALDPEVELDIVAEVLSEFDNIVPVGQRLSLMELSEATCKWPIGDPQSLDFFFCGGRALSGLPYCAQHSRVAYQPASDRRIRRSYR